MSEVLFKKIKNWLNENNIEYKEVHHGPTHSSQASAAARGESMRIGGKALVMKIESEFKIFVISAARKMDSRKIKTFFNAKRTRFAFEDELKELTGAVSGAVPPFGRPIIDLDLYVDRSVTQNNRIAFNAGSLTDSIIMKTEDYLRITKPKIIDFSKE
jgi:Ala-tRNA(Pro) deacylase